MNHEVRAEFLDGIPYLHAIPDIGDLVLEATS
jgi:hypothetical protein